MPKMKNLKVCGFCGRQVYKLANPSRGLCAACYYREKKNGELAYRPVRVRKPCSVENCEGLASSHGYCPTHLSRFRRHGVAEHERFDKWGHVDKHPLAHSYYHMRRTYRSEVVAEWLADFWQFERDVGERPTPRHRLKRIDPAKPYGPGNTFWFASEIDLPKSSKDEAASYARAYRAANPDLYRDQHLRKKYGVSLAWYNEQLEAQGGGCAICKQPESASDRTTGLPRSFAVDHCHAGGQVRALLCTRCNSGLGNFGDDPALLKAAIAYLAKHAIAAQP